MKRALLVVALCWFAPARACDDFTQRPDVREFVIDMQSRHGFAAAELLRKFHRIHCIPAVIKAIQPPANPAIRSWQTYRSRFVEPKRITAGVEFWSKHRAVLERAGQEYGIPAEIIVSIIGVETIYGHHLGKFPTFTALATLAFHYPPRAALFRRELESLLLLARDQGRDPLSYRGSYAGALGLPQFLPSSERSWAVDYDGDGRIDLSASADDAIGSVARFLAEHGWEKGGPIAATANVAGDKAAELLADGITPKRTPRDMESFGVTADNAADQPAALIDLVSPDAPTEYRLGFHNFYVLTRYNQSSFYAIAVFDLSMALKEYCTAGSVSQSAPTTSKISEASVICDPDRRPP